METSTESLCCCEMLEISDEWFNGIYNQGGLFKLCLFHFLYDL